MLAFKRFVTVVVMVYLLLALLFILAPAVRATVMGMGDGLSSLEQERKFFYVMFIIGAVILALHLITENMDSMMLRRSVSLHEGKINELKAKLYDHQQRMPPQPVATARTVEPDRGPYGPSGTGTLPSGTVSSSPVPPPNDGPAI
jgi:hypothetical protein